MSRPKSNLKSVESFPEILIKPEVQDLLRVSKKTIEYLVASRDLPCFKVGKRALRFNKAQVLQWIAEQSK